MKQKKKALVFFAMLIATCLIFTTLAWLIGKIILDRNVVAISDFVIDKKVCFVKADHTNEETNHVPLSTVIDDSSSPISGTINVNLTNPDSNIYIGNLRVAIKVSTISPVYLRARILEGWSEDDEFIPSTFIPYRVPQNITSPPLTGNNFISTEADVSGQKPIFVRPNDVDIYNNEEDYGWFDNRTSDYHFYFKFPIYPNTVDPNVGTLSYSHDYVWIYLINGIAPEDISSIANLRENVDMSLNVTVDAVQPNRYREFWKIDSLPWEEITP